MAKRGSTRAERRDKMAALLIEDPTLSNREVARRVGSDHRTSGRVRRELESAGSIPAQTLQLQPHGGALLAPEANNTRHLTHGAFSERKIAPLREVHEASLRQQFPAVDERLLGLQAHRMAQIELLVTWCDQHGIVKRGGEVYNAARFAEQLTRGFESQFVVLRQMQAEADAKAGQVDWTAHLTALEATNG